MHSSSISSSSSSLCLPFNNNPFLFHHRFNFNFSFSANPFAFRPTKPKPISQSASVTEKNSSFQFSWDKVEPDEYYNGWAIQEVAPQPLKKKTKSLPIFVVTGIGASVVMLLGVFAYFSVTSKGFRFRLKSSFNALNGQPVPTLVDKNDNESEGVVSDVSPEEAEVLEESFGGPGEAFLPKETSPSSMKERTERIIVSLPADFAQQEAMLTLKKLKIIEDDARTDELCTRREYARWLVLANSQLERSRRHRIISPAALSGSRITAFVDVPVEHPDFEHIQSLAEAGVIRSKLSEGNSDFNSDGTGGRLVNFSPERFISREDLVSWKAKIEYEFAPGISEQMSRKNIGFLDAKEISLDVFMEIFMDVLANEKSILRGVFGQSKRLQPMKPCTKAQAAVALTIGRMTEFIKAEILRLEAENVARQSEFNEVMSELLESGGIKEFWEIEMGKEKIRGMEVEMDYHAAISTLEQEKNFQENSLAEIVKKKAALDCQRQLLSSLKDEVAEMSERLASERAIYIDERYGVQNVQHELQENYEKLLDTKSILEAEVEALRILRSWVEDEARKSQARAKVLEEAGRRWKWNS